MSALEAAIRDGGGPVGIVEIRAKLNKSESRIRSHIKVLIESDYVECITRSRQKRYVPSKLWLRISGGEDCSWLNWMCEEEGCSNRVVDFYAGRYLCREHIIGFNEAGDSEDIRRRWLETLGPQSVGIIFEQANSCTGCSHDEDDVQEEDFEKK